MDTSKIIRGVVSNGRYTVTAPIVKEDYGLYLQIEGVELPSTYEVDFSNSEHNGTSVTMIGNADGVLIPSQFISSGKDIFAFLYWVGEDYGKTVYKFRIPNKLRPDRTNEEPTPEEQSVIDQAISVLNSAVAQTAQDVISAGQSAQSAQGYAEQTETARNTAQTYANNAQTSANNASASAQASANSATASANSATTAQGFAQSASASAQSASGYASNAQTSANTASAKAQDASGYAQTASDKATEAAQSASQALSYKTDAESAKTASQTAQGLAESARDSAISAKTDAESAKADAESARDEAQTIVDGISAKTTQIDSNTENIASLTKDKAPVITDTASGAIASFSDGADDLPLKSLVVNIEPVQDLSHGDPSPENICPISGWTEVDVEQSGKNLLNNALNAWEMGRNYIWQESVVPKNTRASMYFEDKDTSVDVTGCYIGFCYDNLTDLTSSPTKFRWIVLNGDIQANKSNSAASFGDTLCEHVFVYPKSAETLNKIFSRWNVMVELGSTATPYSPYTGRSITINLGQTVYGGKLDVLSGELVVDRAMVDLGSLDWIMPSDNRFYTTSLSSVIKKGTDGALWIQSSMFHATSSLSVVYNSLDVMWLSAVGNISVSKIADTATALKTAVTGQQLVYELATPITVQLTPNQVNSLLGVNNLWADSGDTEVEYRADTKLFIERLTAPDSADMIADANITNGKYFMVGNSLYKATANIANGSAIVVGTNCIRKSLSEALNEINA